MIGLVYLVLVALCFVLTLCAVKSYDGSVTVGDVLLTIGVSLVPLLNLIALVLAIATLIACGAGKAFFGKKLF